MPLPQLEATSIDVRALDEWDSPEHRPEVRLARLRGVLAQLDETERLLTQHLVEPRDAPPEQLGLLGWLLGANYRSQRYLGSELYRSWLDWVRSQRTRLHEREERIVDRLGRGVDASARLFLDILLSGGWVTVHAVDRQDNKLQVHASLSVPLVSTVLAEFVEANDHVLLNYDIRPEHEGASIRLTFDSTLTPVEFLSILDRHRRMYAYPEADLDVSEAKASARP